MITADDIIITLKEELRDYIKSSRDPYKSDIAEVREGIHGHTDIVNKPFLGVHIIDDDVDTEVFDTMGNDAIMKVVIQIYCYIDGGSLGDYSTMNQLYKDIRYFLKYDFSYKGYTWRKSYKPIKGGVSIPLNYFELNIEIQYQEEI